MEHLHDVNEDSSDDYVEVNDSECLHLEEQTSIVNVSFMWITVLSEAIVTCVMGFGILFFLLQVDEVLNDSNHPKKIMTNNIIEILFLFICFIAVTLHLIRFRRNVNSFIRLDFDNYPMLFVMIICALIDISYYIISFVSIFTKCIDPIRLIATLAELSFIVVLLPFVFICVSTNVRQNNLTMELKTKVSILLAIGGCSVIMMRKLALKIEKDSWNISTPNCSDINANFIHKNASTAESLFQVLDVTYVLIGLIFLIDPLMKVTNLQKRKNNINFESLTMIPHQSFLTNASMIRFRWPTVIVFVFLVEILLCMSYFVTEILESKILGLRFKQDSLKVYLSCTIVIYLLGIAYSAIYYMSDVRHWPMKKDIYLRNDEYFNKLTSAGQIIYSSGMMLSLFYIDNISLIIVEFFDFFFLTVQVLVQTGCIDAAIKRDVKRNNVSNWKSKLFPPIALAILNFGFMLISIVYSQNPIFLHVSGDHETNHRTPVVIKDFALPITILNRLHGMTFFINLSKQQWRPTL